MTIQPLLMNFISLFVMGYIARKLGPSDFGIFNFSTSFILLFYPIAVLGLNRINVRDLSTLSMIEKGIYVSKMLPIRLVTTVISIFLIILFTNILDYPMRTTYALYMSCIILTFQLILEFFNEMFNSLERMEYTALTKMIAGLSLTIMSVIILFMGYRLYALIGVYAFGQMIGAVLAIVLLKRNFLNIQFNIDSIFIRVKIKDGFPFFLMTMFWFLMERLDTIILSKKLSMEELGLYTSAILLITRISIVPQGISNAMLPTISKLYKQGKLGEISDITATYFNKILFIILPGCIMVSYFSDEIMGFIFGNEYRDAGIILSIGIWVFLVRCIAGVEFAILTAFYKQKLMTISYFIATIYCLIANITLVKLYGSMGGVIAFSSTQLVILLLCTIIMMRSVNINFQLDELLKIITLNVLLFVVFFIFRSFNFFLVVISTLFLYLLCAFFCRLLKIADLIEFGIMVKSRYFK